MKSDRLGIAVLTVIALGLAVTSSPAAAKDVPAELPRPDGKAPDTTKPIKVFILSGQSNMCGMGSIARSLTPLVKEKKKFPNLVDEAGNWTTRNDTFYLYNLKKPNDKACPLSVNANGRNVGPELQFGHIMGYMHDEVVLVIKACCGNRCLAYDVLPPSMREGKESNPRWPLGCEYDKWFCQYTKDMLNNLDKVLPGYKGQGYEVAGFGWWQGHKDINKPEWNRDYERNLVALIKDLRAEFKAPKAPFVVATIAFGGKGMSGNALKILQAQMAVSDAKKYPDFAGNVASVDCRPFYRGGGAHYGNNAETYMLVGDGMGRAMARLILAKSIASTTASAEDRKLVLRNGEKIAFMGDSITAGGARKHGYVNLVMEALNKEGLNLSHVPAGKSGHKSNDMLKRLENDVISKKPQCMTLSCGVNDVWHFKLRLGRRTFKGVPLEEYKKNITAIIDKAQAANIQVMILTSTMIGEDPERELNENLIPYNAFLRAIAKEKNCLLADLNKDMQEALKAMPDVEGRARMFGEPKYKRNIKNKLTTDGCHMNALGNIMMAKGILRAFGLSEKKIAAANKSWLSAK